MHTTETLKLLHDSLRRFHDNKDIIIDLGICDSFHIPKLHFLSHYVMYIELYGTTDNCNTEYTKCLHINLAKDAWGATNHKDEFPQMTLWLEHHKKISQHAKFINWQIGNSPNPPDQPNPGILYRRQLQMAKHLSKKSVHFHSLTSNYGAADFQDALAEFIVGLRDPHL
jgi:hypothetical protein